MRLPFPSATREQLRHPHLPVGFPNIVVLCGSTRYGNLFHEMNLRFTLSGLIVLSIGCDTKSDADLALAGRMLDADKQKLDELHKRKIDLADYVFVINVNGYIGDSTHSEIQYARDHGKPIYYLEEPAVTQ